MGKIQEMKDSKKCDQHKTLRLPHFLVKKVSEHDVPKCKTESDKYRYFLETGVSAFEEFKETITNPEYKKRAESELENMFVDGMIVENLMNMDASKLKGLSMAVDMVRGKRKI